MFIDITLKVTPSMVKDAHGNERKSIGGHIGTHFDVMNKEFPLEFVEREAILFDVQTIRDRDIEVRDIDMEQVRKDMFVTFYSGFIEEVGYGGSDYFQHHPQLSNALIEELLDREVSIIGVDFAGIRRGKQHTSMDQYCADKGVFIIENLCNLGAIMKQCKMFTACTYPMNFTDMTGLPCRVVAKI